MGVRVSLIKKKDEMCTKSQAEGKVSAKALRQK